jgi:hypothetical protein
VDSSETSSTVQPATAPVSVDLPAEVLSRLDPDLRELYLQLSVPLASRIAVLVIAARSPRIDPNRVLRYAFLYATAERQAEGDAVSKEQTRRAKRELAGEIHDLETGDQDDAEATRRYRAGRRARQQIQASLDALLGQSQVFEQVVEKHRSELPAHLQSRFSDSVLRGLVKGLHRMRIATVLDEEDLTSEKNAGPSGRSAIAQTYIWWCLIVAPYSNKWRDMHQLAFAWRMSPTRSLNDFRIVVNRISKDANSASSFGSPWDSMLSKPF